MFWWRGGVLVCVWERGGVCVWEKRRLGGRGVVWGGGEWFGLDGGVVWVRGFLGGGEGEVGFLFFFGGGGVEGGGEGEGGRFALSLSPPLLFGPHHDTHQIHKQIGQNWPIQNQENQIWIGGIRMAKSWIGQSRFYPNLTLPHTPQMRND